MERFNFVTHALQPKTEVQLEGIMSSSLPSAKCELLVESNLTR